MTRKLFGPTGIYTDDLIEAAREALTTGKSPVDLVAIRDQLDCNDGIEIDDIHVADYQRHSDAKEARQAILSAIKIIRSFKLKAYLEPTIGFDASGTAFALDGAHRLIVAKIAGAEAIKCNTKDVDDEAEAAMIFNLINVGRRSVSPHAKARASAIIDLTSEEAQLSNLLAEHDRRLADADIGGVVLAKNFVKTFGAEGFGVGLQHHLSIWPDQKVQAEVVNAIAHVAMIDEAYDANALVESIRAEFQNPKHLMNAVVVKGSGHRHGQNRVQAIAEHILKLYNAKAGSAAKLKASDLAWHVEERAKAKAKAEKVKAKAKAEKAKAEKVAVKASMKVSKTTVQALAA